MLKYIDVCPTVDEVAVEAAACCVAVGEDEIVDIRVHVGCEEKFVEERRELQDVTEGSNRPCKIHVRSLDRKPSFFHYQLLLNDKDKSINGSLRGLWCLENRD
jgi:hypothetical protein